MLRTDLRTAPVKIKLAVASLALVLVAGLVTLVYFLTRKPAPPPSDKSTPPSDKSTPPSDKSTPPSDKSTPPSDKSTPPSDRSTPPSDKSTPPSESSEEQQKTLFIGIAVAVAALFILTVIWFLTRRKSRKKETVKIGKPQQPDDDDQQGDQIERREEMIEQRRRELDRLRDKVYDLEDAGENKEAEQMREAIEAAEQLLETNRTIDTMGNLEEKLRAAEKARAGLRTIQRSLGKRFSIRAIKEEAEKGKDAVRDSLFKERKALRKVLTDLIGEVKGYKLAGAKETKPGLEPENLGPRA